MDDQTDFDATHDTTHEEAVAAAQQHVRETQERGAERPVDLPMGVYPIDGPEARQILGAIFGADGEFHFGEGPIQSTELQAVDRILTPEQEQRVSALCHARDLLAGHVPTFGGPREKAVAPGDLFRVANFILNGEER